MDYTPVTSFDLQRRIKDGSPILILDVRDREKYQTGTLSAKGVEVKNIPFVEMKQAESELNEQLELLSKEIEIVTVCTTGNKARKAAEYLQSLGFQARELEGGLTAWRETTSSNPHKLD